MDNCQVCHGSIEAISLLDPLDVEETYCQMQSCFPVYNDTFDHVDGVMRALARKKTQCKQDLFFTVNLA